MPLVGICHLDDHRAVMFILDSISDIAEQLVNPFLAILCKKSTCYLT